MLVRDAAKGAPWQARERKVRVLASLSTTRPRSRRSARGGEARTCLLAAEHGRSGLPRPGIARDRRRARGDQAGRVPHVVFLIVGRRSADERDGADRTVHYGERRLAETGAKLTFVRAAYFLENWAAVAAAAKGGKLPTFLPADLVIPMVATRDIGAVAAKALLDRPPLRDRRHRAVGCEGPLPETAAIFRAARRPERRAERPLDAVVPTFTSFGASASVAASSGRCTRIARGTVAWEEPEGARGAGTADRERPSRVRGADGPCARTVRGPSMIPGSCSVIESGTQAWRRRASRDEGRSDCHEPTSEASLVLPPVLEQQRSPSSCRRDHSSVASVRSLSALLLPFEREPLARRRAFVAGGALPCEGCRRRPRPPCRRRPSHPSVLRRRAGSGSGIGLGRARVAFGAGGIRRGL
ncbi:MAG: hypothetical protein KF850_20235 [Labilithrix sp.]|nr:hypothetical protein [Labilithrix sp.]